jgi:hypothetical protein
VALARGNPVEVQAAQDFWLKCSETLRRLDLAVEVARRSEEEQIPKKLGQEVALYISDWLRIAFIQFLSSEARPLMGIHDVGEWKVYAFERFKGILDLVVQSSLRTNSPIPDWAASKVAESWNMASDSAELKQRPHRIVPSIKARMTKSESLFSFWSDPL